MTLAANKTQNQNMTPAPVGGGRMGAFRQRTTESILYMIDYSRWLADDEKIVSANWSISPVTDHPPHIADFSIEDDQVIFIRIDGGKEGYKYVFTIDVDTSEHQQKEDWFTIRFGVVGDEAAFPYVETALSRMLAVVSAVENNAKAAASSAAQAATDATITGNIKTETERVRDAAKEAEASAKDAAKESGRQSGLSHDFAEVAEAFAEYMPGEIPHDLLHRINLEGSYHSARWWADRSAGLATRLMELYLGVFDTPPTTGLDGGLIPPGAIYYDSTNARPYVWTGTEWRVFWAPEKASTSTLYYVATNQQVAFPLTTLDIFGSDYTFDPADPEAVEIYVNGVRVLPDFGPNGSLALGPAAVQGDYSVDFPNNIVTFREPLPANTIVMIDILTPRSKLAPGSVTIMPLWDININSSSLVAGDIDGTRTDFTLYLADGTTPVNASGSEEIFLSLDGVVQNPGVDYTVFGSTLVFARAPAADASVWGMWFKPGGGGSGAGVVPPVAPDDKHTNAYDWRPTALGGKGAAWRDNRGDVRSVANQAERLALNDPAEIIAGTLVYERDTKNLWVYNSGGTPAGSWTLLLPGHPTDAILRALEYDPSKPNSMAWEDNRDEMETVNAEADLSNRTVLPASHLAVGKLVYVRATGQLWECIVDGTTGTITNTIADFKPLGGAGVTYVGRIGNLPDPTVKTIPDGSLFMVNMDLVGNEYHRLYVFDAQGVNAAGVVGVYRTCSTKDFIKALRSDPDQGLDAEPGDIQMTLENGHKEIKAVDATSAWQVVYSEDQVKSWIAASNLFQGTVEEPGHGTKGAIDLDKLPAETALGITDAGHYFVWVGTSGHIIGATEVGGAASAIAGARLSVGDWLVAANTGTAAAPVMKWTHIPGDLLSKGRGDGLYGLNNWVAGAYEQGSLVCFNGDIYKASQPVLATDIAPGATPTTPGATNPWAKVNISGGVKTVASDTNLPAGAANGAVYLVLSSAQAGGKGAMYMWDQAAAKWQSLGGGGVPMSLSGGKKLINYGSPIGSVIAFAGKVMPAGYKLCDGSTFDQTTFPELFKVLGNSNILPDLRDQFIRGANTLADVSFVKHDATTGMPKNHFTGVSNSSGSHTHTTDNPGDHRHNVGFSMSNHNWKGGGGWTGDATCNFAQDGGASSSANGGHTHTTTSNGAHTHSIEINSGGDPEGTAPKHVVLCYIIKVDDVGIRHAS